MYNKGSYRLLTAHIFIPSHSETSRTTIAVVTFTKSKDDCEEVDYSNWLEGSFDLFMDNENLFLNQDGKYLVHPRKYIITQ